MSLLLLVGAVIVAVRRGVGSARHVASRHDVEGLRHVILGLVVAEVLHGSIPGAEGTRGWPAHGAVPMLRRQGVATGNRARGRARPGVHHHRVRPRHLFGGAHRRRRATGRREVRGRLVVVLAGPVVREQVRRRRGKNL